MKIANKSMKSSKFKDRLKEAMENMGISQAKLVQLTNIPKSAMSQYLSGAFVPKQERLSILAQALNVQEAWLLGYDVPMRREQKYIIYNEATGTYDTEESPYVLQVSDDMSTMPIETQKAIAEQIKSISKSTGMSSAPTANLHLFASNTPTYTDHEQNLIQAYRSKPEMRAAVDRLLGIEEDNKNTVYTVYNAAIHPDNHEGIIEMDAERWNQMEDTPKTDDELL